MTASLHSSPGCVYPGTNHPNGMLRTGVSQSSPMDRMFHWSEVASVPDEPGIYAWYYSPEITDFDLEATTEAVRRLRGDGDRQAAGEAVETFLERAIFRYFHEEPFSAVLRGPLKPSYEGTLAHRPSMSTNLVDRIIEDPERLRTIKHILEASAPDFASPIYIGMSERLRRRLGHHKKLIERYRESRPSPLAGVGERLHDERRDQSFAQQVSERNIAPSRLFVMVKVISDVGNRYVDLENILNRIHYPLMGRN